MVGWNPQGDEIGSISLGEDIRFTIRWDTSPFELDKKTFWNGRIYPDKASIPSERLGSLFPSWVQEDELVETTYHLEPGFTLVERRRNRFDEEHTAGNVEIQLESPDGHWAGELPYLADGGTIAAIALGSGKLLVGSHLGHVECIDAFSGESLWLYVFPTMRRTMSYSSPNGMPPMMSQAAAMFREQNRNPPASGLTLSGQDAAVTRVILDPDPMDPFSRLPLLLSIAWSGAVIPLLAIIVFHTHPRTRRSDNGFTSLALTVLTFMCFMGLARVSPASFMALGVAILSGAAFSIFDAVCYFRRRRWVAGSVIFAAAAWIGFLILRVVFPF